MHVAQSKVMRSQIARKGVRQNETAVVQRAPRFGVGRRELNADQVILPKYRVHCLATAEFLEGPRRAYGKEDGKGYREANMVMELLESWWRRVPRVRKMGTPRSMVRLVCRLKRHA
jgi:hypothetical protein